MMLVVANIDASPIAGPRITVARPGQELEAARVFAPWLAADAIANATRVRGLAGPYFISHVAAFAADAARLQSCRTNR